LVHTHRIHTIDGISTFELVEVGDEEQREGFRLGVKGLPIKFEPAMKPSDEKLDELNNENGWEERYVIFVEKYGLTEAKDSWLESTTCSI
jgi:hypothetical protein